MNWKTWIIFGVALALFALVKRMALVTPQAAHECLKRGAQVIDVRSEAEFRERHLPGTLNIPLNRLRDDIAGHVPDKQQPLLLFCLSGGRSGIGKSILKRMGYRRALNLGSYGRAEKILAK